MKIWIVESHDYYPETISVHLNSLTAMDAAEKWLGKEHAVYSDTAWTHPNGAGCVSLPFESKAGKTYTMWVYPMKVED